MRRFDQTGSERGVCVLLMTGGVGKAAGPSASGSHFSKKATASLFSTFSGKLTSLRLDLHERFFELVKLVCEESHLFNQRFSVDLLWVNCPRPR